jgi:hypothetical protein
MIRLLVFGFTAAVGNRSRQRAAWRHVLEHIDADRTHIDDRQINPGLFGLGMLTSKLSGRFERRNDVDLHGHWNSIT